MKLQNVFGFLGGAFGLVNVGFDLFSVRGMRNDIKEQASRTEALFRDQASRIDAQTSRADALITAQASRTDAIFAALLEERRLQAEASREAHERFFRLLEEVKSIKRNMDKRDIM
jgi:deferrochelatase/peroxidase EfeB